MEGRPRREVAKAAPSYVDDSDDDIIDSDLEERALACSRSHRILACQRSSNNALPSVDNELEERLLARCKGGHISPSTIEVLLFCFFKFI